MKKLLVLLCICSIFAFGFAMAEEAAKAEHLVTATWIHPADGGEVTVTVDASGAWTICKVFKPAKEGAKVPVIEPKHGQMMDKWFGELTNAMKNIDWANFKGEYRVSDQTFTGPCKMILTHEGKQVTTNVGAAGGPMPQPVAMINNIVGILNQVRGQ